jgi:hypothetical protein
MLFATFRKQFLWMHRTILTHVRNDRFARQRFGKPLVRMKVPRKDQFVADYFPRCCEFTALGFADLRMARQSIMFATMLRGTRSRGTTPVDAVENSASQRVSISGEG